MIKKQALYWSEMILCTCDEFAPGEFLTSCFRQVVFDVAFLDCTFKGGVRDKRKS